MKKSSFLIIGGGASGLVCAITLRRLLPTSEVTVLEKLSIPGKKILATGNGRCNLSNMEMGPQFYNGDKKVISLILDSFDTKTCIDFFESIGLLTTIDDSRIYPMSMSAVSVQKLLIRECDKLSVNIITNSTVESVERCDNEFKIRTTNGEYIADNCILAIGGKAASKHGTDGDGYRILKSLGVKYDSIFPALVQIKTDVSSTESLKGVRVRGTVSIDNMGTQTGEIQFTDYGISGIAAMQFSGQIAKMSSNGENPIIHLDLCPDIDEIDLRNFLREHGRTVLDGLLPEKLSKVISDISATDTEIEKNIKDFRLTATGTNSFKDAQVTAGGVGSDMLLPKSLQAKNIPGLFICGELLNVDGHCGGYNLHFAWGSGILAAKEAAKLASNQ